MDSSTKSISPQRKGIGRKDKERLKQIKRMQLQQQRLKRQKEQAELQLSRLRDTGLVHAYQSFLRSLCVNGLPEQCILYEKAAQFILQYEKKMKKKIQKQQNFESIASQVLKKSRSRSISPVELQTSQQKPKREKKERRR